MTSNYEILHSFEKGMQTDLNDNFESNKSVIFAENCRLISENGILSYSDLKGTKHVYTNPHIVKYLGAAVFSDEIILIVKYDTEVITPPSSTIIIEEPNYNNIITSETIDLTRYYNDVIIPELTEYCPDEVDNDEIYNNEYSDAIISLTHDTNGVIHESILWNGNMNLDINRKIVTKNIYENSDIKRVYFTDYLNPLRSINIKDLNLASYGAKQFNIISDAQLLQSYVDTIGYQGQLKAMSVQYVHRLTTYAGNITTFSQLSEITKIVKEDNAEKYRGGDVSENTNKNVNVICPVLNYEDFKEIECFAIEFETDGIPTSIVSLGTKNVQEINNFIHDGNESKVKETLSFSEIIDNSNIWKYCSSLEINNNKLIAGAIRNEPFPYLSQELEELFLLKGFDENGTTHNTLINEEPYNYRYIDPNNRDSYIAIEKRLFTKINVYGSFKIKLINNITNEYIETSFFNSLDEYTSYLNSIFNWLEGEDLTVKFPNLTVSKVSQGIVFERTLSTIKTNLSDYVIIINNPQHIIDYKNQYDVNTNINVDIDNLIYGYQSWGFNDGTGVRITFTEDNYHILSKDTVNYQGTGPFLNLEAPNDKKYFMKDEIYRLAIQLYKDGIPLFAIPLGDIKTPILGKVVKDLTYDPLNPDKVYKNFYEENNKLYTSGICLSVDFTLECKYKKYVDSYQLVYVERTEKNRTILTQGLATPLTRIREFNQSTYFGQEKVPEVFRKWTLAHRGGIYTDGWGLSTFDDHGENYNDDVNIPPDESAQSRIITARNMFTFDSPDLIYNKISDNLIENGTCEILNNIRPDNNLTFHTPVQPVVPSDTTFSRRIKGYNIDYDEEWWRLFLEDKELSGYITGKENTPGKIEYFTDISILTYKHDFTPEDNIPIEKARTMLPGQIIPSTELNAGFELSNNAITFGQPAFYYDYYTRVGFIAADGEQAYSTLWINGINRLTGNKTVFIRTKENIFTPNFYNLDTNVNSLIFDPYLYYDDNKGFDKLQHVTDSHAIINIKLNNIDTIYGGRNIRNFKDNIYIPLSRIIPITDEYNGSQHSKIYGDTYVSLFIREKTNFPDDIGIDISGDKSEIAGYKLWDNSNACPSWSYGVVLETQVEERLTSNSRNYRKSDSVNFTEALEENINEAYNQNNNLKYYIPKPNDFIETIEFPHIISASKTKIKGEITDSWSQFQLNNFYELDRDKGVVHNLVEFNDFLFAIQKVTSKISIDVNAVITTSDGPISIEKGIGKYFNDHKEISQFGTQIRRNIIVVPNDNYYFFDENKIEFIMGIKPLLKENNLYLSTYKKYNNKIIDINWFYDIYNNEVNCQINDGEEKHTYSYNLLLKVFNGIYKIYDNDIFIQYKNNIYTPKASDKTKLYQLNEGNIMHFFDIYYDSEIHIIVNEKISMTKILKALTLNLQSDDKVYLTTITDSSGYEVMLTDRNKDYIIREGMHTFPTQNALDNKELRGQYFTIKFKFKNRTKNIINKFSNFIAYLRKSYL